MLVIPKRNSFKAVTGFEESTTSFSTMEIRSAELKCGGTSFNDDSGEGPLNTDENTQKLHNMVLEDQRLKLYEITQAIGISKERIRYILPKELTLRKLC